jgi:AcrR family transcriptional regulator
MARWSRSERVFECCLRSSNQSVAFVSHVVNLLTKLDQKNECRYSWSILSKWTKPVAEQEALNNDQPTRKQQQRSVVTQQKLLNAAIDAFADNGFKGTSTRDIAERAGVHHPLITYHFKNKDQLWRAAADYIFSAFSVSLAKSLEEHRDDCPKTQMSALIRAYVRYAKDHPALHKVMVQEASYPNPRLDWLIDEHLKPLFGVTIGMLGKLQELGVAVPGNTALLFSMIRLSTGGLLALGNELKNSSGLDIEDPDALKDITEMVIRVFLPGEVPAAAPVRTAA